MNQSPDDLDGHLEVLVRLKRRGGDVYRRALRAARVAVARVILTEAERLAGADRPRPPGTVVRFRPRTGDMDG